MDTDKKEYVVVEFRHYCGEEWQDTPVAETQVVEDRGAAQLIAEDIASRNHVEVRYNIAGSNKGYYAKGDNCPEIVEAYPFFWGDGDKRRSVERTTPQGYQQWYSNLDFPPATSPRCWTTSLKH